jgi:hypothetical protein
MFRALLAHSQETLHKRHLAYCMRVMSVGCYQGWSGTPWHGMCELDLTVIRYVGNSIEGV